MAFVSKKYPVKVLGGLLLASLAIVLAAPQARSADEVKEVPRKAVAHVYPEKLTPKDVLLDGQNGKKIEITAETTLIWVDLHPDARYAHPTEYVLITPRGTQVVKGEWWPVLNGKDILRGEKAGQVNVPIEVKEGG